MKPTTKIYLIDDQFNRHLEHTSLVKDLKQEGFDGDVVSNESEAQIKAAKCITPAAIWSFTTTADTNSVFLVDLQYLGVDESASKRAFEQLWKEADKTLQSKVSDLLKEAEEWGILNQYYSAIFACAVLKARNIPTIIISSAAVQVGRDLQSNWKIPLSVGTGIEEWPTWKSDILNLLRHPDPSVRDMLIKYQKPIAADDRAWDHDWCAERQGIADGRALLSLDQFYVDGPNGSGEEKTENQAFFERNRDAWVFEVADCTVTRPTLESSLKAIGITAKVSCPTFRFPVHPGLAFLIALKELIKASNDKGTSFELEFFSLPENEVLPTLCGLHIYLKATDTDACGYNSTLRLLEKLSQAGSDKAGPNGGFSEGIWNLGHCKSKGIRTHDDSWAEMFRMGSQHWVAWPSFSKNLITFHW